VCRPTATRLEEEEEEEVELQDHIGLAYLASLVGGSEAIGLNLHQWHLSILV